MICAFCGDDHSWFYCRKKPEDWKPPKKPIVGRPKNGPAKKSTAALKEVLRIDRPVVEAVETPRREGDSPADEMSVIVGADRRAAAGPAGTQAPPVDTNSLRTNKASSGNADGSKPLTQTKPAKRGRPKTITDMRAYKAKKEHDRRDRIRAAKAAKESK